MILRDKLGSVSVLALSLSIGFFCNISKANAWSCRNMTPNTPWTNIECHTDNGWRERGYVFSKEDGDKQYHTHKEKLDIGSGEKREIGFKVQSNGPKWLADYGSIFARCFKERIETKEIGSCGGKSRSFYFAIDKKITISADKNPGVGFTNKKIPSAGELTIVFTRDSIHGVFLDNKVKCDKDSDTCEKEEDLVKDFNCNKLSSQLNSIEDELKYKMLTICSELDQANASQQADEAQVSPPDSGAISADGLAPF